MRELGSAAVVELETKAIRRFAKVSIVSYSRPSLMIIASASQFHVHLPLDQRPFSIGGHSHITSAAITRQGQSEC